MLYFVCFGISLYTEPQTFHLGSGANVMLSTQNHACFPGRDFICIYIYIYLALYKTGHWKQTTRKKRTIVYSSFCKLFWTYMVTYHYSIKRFLTSAGTFCVKYSIIYFMIMIQANVSLDFTQELDVCSLHKYCTVVF